jgi:hypothetical protein
MFENLNTRTREIIRSLCKGKRIKLGDQSIDTLSDKGARLLSVLASNLPRLTDLKGQDLVEEVARFLTEATKEAELAPEDAHEGKEDHGHRDAPA